MHTIYDYIQNIRMIDGHEHLATQQMREKDQTNLFGLLHYLESDLITAGMNRGVLSKQHGITDEEKAQSSRTIGRKLATQLMQKHFGRQWKIYTA